MREITAASLVIASPRKRGRPAVAEPLKPVSAQVPPAYLDRLDQMALKHDVTVSKVLRSIIGQALAKPNFRID